MQIVMSKTDKLMCKEVGKYMIGELLPKTLWRVEGTYRFLRGQIISKFLF